MFVEREKATLAVVETVDGSVVKVLSKVCTMTTQSRWRPRWSSAWRSRNQCAQGMFVVGSGVDVTAVKTHLQDLVPVPVIAPEEPQLALARGAALASARAPRYDTSTIGLAYSQVPDGTSLYPMALVDHATTFLGHADVATDPTDIASDSDVPQHSKPFLLVGSSLAAVFIAGMMALTITMVANVQPTGDQGSTTRGASRRCGASPAYAGCAAHCAAAAAQDRPRPRSGGTTTRAHRHGTADGIARPAAAGGGPQRGARPRRATTRTRPAAARCACAGATAAGHPVAATDCSATAAATTPLLQPGSEGSVAWRRRSWWRAWARRRLAPRVRSAVHGCDDRNAQPATGHAPSSDVVSMMRPNATQARHTRRRLLLQLRRGVKAPDGAVGSAGALFGGRGGDQGDGMLPKLPAADPSRLRNAETSPGAVRMGRIAPARARSSRSQDSANRTGRRAASRPKRIGPPGRGCGRHGMADFSDGDPVGRQHPGADELPAQDPLGAGDVRPPPVGRCLEEFPFRRED